MIKLDQHQYEVLTVNGAANVSQSTATTSTSTDLNDAAIINENFTTKQYANPTPTKRHSTVFKLTPLEIPKICMDCLSVRCYCNDYY